MASAVAMNVFGTVITSSPGPIPSASRVSQSASVPLPTRMARSNLSIKGACCALRSRKGTFICGFALLSVWNLDNYGQALNPERRAGAGLVRHSSGECFSLEKLFRFGASGSRRCTMRTRKCHRCAVHLDGSGSRFEDPDHLQSLTATRYRLRIRFDAINKMLAGH